MFYYCHVSGRGAAGIYTLILNHSQSCLICCFTAAAAASVPKQGVHVGYGGLMGIAPSKDVSGGGAAGIYTLGCHSPPVPLPRHLSRACSSNGVGAAAGAEAAGEGEAALCCCQVALLLAPESQLSVLVLSNTADAHPTGSSPVMSRSIFGAQVRGGSSCSLCTSVT